MRVDASTATTLSATYPQPVLSNPQIPPQGGLEVREGGWAVPGQRCCAGTLSHGTISPPDRRAYCTQVSFSVLKSGVAIKPQQTMVVVKNKATGLSAYAVARAKGAGTFVATVTTATVEKQLGKLVSPALLPACVVGVWVAAPPFLPGPIAQCSS